MRFSRFLPHVAVVVAAIGFVSLTGSRAEQPKTPEAKAAAAQKLGATIDGFRYEFPCKNPMPEKPAPGMDCDSGLVKGDPNKTDNFMAERKFNGEKGKHYKVTLRFRGVVEPMMYKNGKMDGEYFYIGGEPNNATYNIYKLSVSSPSSHYFLNRQDKVGHKIFTIDYTKTIEMDGDATITLLRRRPEWQTDLQFRQAGRSRRCSAPKPFNGQFVQVNVVEVVESK